jgi:predicted lipoprotein with Yx(FWY)xxD motif
MPELETQPNINQGQNSARSFSLGAKTVAVLIILTAVGVAIYLYFPKQNPTPINVINEVEELPSSGRHEKITIQNKGNIGVATTLGGEKYLVDRDGMTLYYNNADANQKGSTLTWSCTASCERNWLPYVVDESSIALSPSTDPLLKFLNTFKRSDNQYQYALESRLLYRYRGDEAQGDMKGENWGAGWVVARP